MAVTSKREGRGADALQISANSTDLALLVSVQFSMLTGVLLIFLFPNFSSAKTIAIFLTFVAIPLFWLGVHRRKSWGRIRKVRPRFVVTASLFATALVALHSASLALYSSFYNLAPFRELELGNGFNEDSAFHVSIINSIILSGVPSTLQDFVTPFRYHALSHYFDAVLATVFSLNPWDSYGLLFYLKGALVVLLILNFVARVSETLTLGQSWAILGSSLPGIVGSWFIVGSHGQWVPVAVLLSAAPWLLRKMSQPSVSTRDFFSFSALVLVVSLGKLSLGFGLAVFLGLWLLQREPRGVRVYLLGSVWVTFFSFWASGYPLDVKTVEPHQLFDNLSAEFFSTALLASLCIWAGRLARDRDVVRAGLSGLYGLAVLSAVAVLFLPSGAEAYHFAFGLFLPVALFSVGLIAKKWPSLHEVAQESEPSSLRVLTLFSVLALAFSPVIATGPFSPYESFQDMTETVVRTATISPARTSIVLGNHEQSGAASPTYFEEFRAQVFQTLRNEGLEPREAALFLSAKDFEYLDSRFSFDNDEFSGLLVTAITGLPLVRGVPLDNSGFYGFATYAEDSFRVSLEDFEKTHDCSLGKTVLLLTQRESPKFSIRC